MRTIIFVACGGMLYSNESSVSSKMVTNVELAKEVDEKNKLMEEKTRLLDKVIKDMEDKLKEIEDIAQAKEDGDFRKSKEKVSLEHEIPKSDPPLGEQEPLLKFLNVFRGKILENVS